MGRKGLAYPCRVEDGVDANEDVVKEAEERLASPVGLFAGCWDKRTHFEVLPD